MNHDDNNPDLRPLIDPELEARVVAWVSGEASAFEVAELERLIAEKPELAIFKRRIEAVRGLVVEAIRPDPQPLLLAPERRAKLLQAIGAPEASTASVNQPLAATKRTQRKSMQWMYAVAACLVAGFFTVLFMSNYRTYKRPVRELSPAATMRMELPGSAAHAGNGEQAKGDRSVAANGSLEVSREAVAIPNEEVAILERRAEGPTDGSNLVVNGRKEKLFKQEESRLRGVESAQAAMKRRAGELAANQPAKSLTTPDATPRQGDSYFSYDRAKPLAGPAPAAPGGSPHGFDNYNTSSTLAGSRLNTEVKDVGSSVTVVTGQFLRDLKATNADGAQAYGQTEAPGGAGGRSISVDPNKKLSVAPPAPAVNSILFGVGQSAAGGKVAGLADKENEQIVLSPFSFNVDTDKGYHSAKVIAGVPLEVPVMGDELKKPHYRADGDDKPLPRAAPKPAAPVFPEVSAAKEPVSTFSLHVSDVSFRLAQAALARGEAPAPETIRPEEFYNAFDYGDPNPALAEKVSCRIEQAAHPFMQQRNLVRIALKVAASGRDAAQPLRLTVLLDTSGSMEREDRVAIVQRAMASLLSLLGPNDRITVIGFARQPRLLVESIAGDQAGGVLDLIAHTPAEGGTNLEEALKLGHELAGRQFAAAAQNRIVLLTDGAANLGNAQPAQLAATIEALRQQGIAFDACGVGLEGLDDDMLENLTRKGDGRYYVLNSPEAADANFAQQLAGAFRPAAENVKLQVRFNPQRVGQYRLIGFEKHRLNEEDFRNDQVDAAELAAEEAAVAVYQVEALPQGEGELGDVYVRFRDAATGNMVERSWTLAYQAQTAAFDRASPSLQLAGSAALFAEMLRGGGPDGAGDWGELAPAMNRLRSQYAGNSRVQELIAMFEQARRLAGK
ncbi:MAG TPA: von Willebrand factor type A domain-containing protein [Lacunisphaera sp.]|nr:von Willebrand factor type A domain-containing protein [Lacunisphaera sp.]